MKNNLPKYLQHLDFIEVVATQDKYCLLYINFEKNIFYSNTWLEYPNIKFARFKFINSEFYYKIFDSECKFKYDKLDKDESYFSNIFKSEYKKYITKNLLEK